MLMKEISLHVCKNTTRISESLIIS